MFIQRQEWRLKSAEADDESADEKNDRYFENAKIALNYLLELSKKKPYVWKPNDLIEVDGSLKPQRDLGISPVDGSAAADIQLRKMIFDDLKDESSGQISLSKIIDFLIEHQTNFARWFGKENEEDGAAADEDEEA